MLREAPQDIAKASLKRNLEGFCAMVLLPRTVCLDSLAVQQITPSG
jgi:hypothetical protein